MESNIVIHQFHPSPFLHVEFGLFVFLTSVNLATKLGTHENPIPVPEPEPGTESRMYFPRKRRKKEPHRQLD